MKTVGIIAEYNPFHNGHRYHLEQAKQQTGADYAVVLMSGSFTQRGTAACFDKFARTRMALQNGADLVIELPVCYAVSSAETFAEGGVSLLAQTGVINALCFGAEPDKNTAPPESLFLSAAAFFADEPAAYRAELKKQLKAGLSFPLARKEAAGGFLPPDAAALLSSPNNLLGLEYCKALLRLHAPFSAVPVARQESRYGDLVLPAASPYASAAAVREALQALLTDRESLLERLSFVLPDNCLPFFKQEPLLCLWQEDFFPLLRYRLLYKEAPYSAYLDISMELSNRLEHTPPLTSYEALVAALKTKQYTRTRIERALLHVLLNIRAEEFAEYRENRTGYLRVLGFRKEAAPLLKTIRANTAVPLITRLADAKRTLSSREYALLSHDIRAARLYNGQVFQKYRVLLPDDYAYIVIT